MRDLEIQPSTCSPLMRQASRVQDLRLAIAPASASAPIDFAGIHQELVGHKYLTLQLVWEEYKQSNLDGYQYSWFCQRYRDWLKTRDLVLRQDHRARRTGRHRSGFRDACGSGRRSSRCPRSRCRPA